MNILRRSRFGDRRTVIHRNQELKRLCEPLGGASYAEALITLKVIWIITILCNH